MDSNFRFREGVTLSRSGGRQNEAPATCTQSADAAHTIQEFQHYACPTGHVAFWNKGPKIPISQPGARELQEADGLAAIKKSICR